MKIWIVEIGEPLPLEKDIRLHRYGEFSKALAQFGHDVTWWVSSFSHAPKKHFVDKDSEIHLNGVRHRFIRGPGYARNVSFARIKHNKHFAARLAELIEQAPKPDLIISPIPIIEAAEVMVKYGIKHNVPVLTDIRDEWPDDLKNLAPKPLRPLARMALFRAYQRMNFVCHNVTGIMAVAQKQLNFGLRFSGRSQNQNDFIFPLGYSARSLPESKIEEGRKWSRDIGIRPEAFTVCFFGTIGNYFNLETAIKAAKVLEKEMDIQFVLAGDGSRLPMYKKMAEGMKSVIFPGWVDAPKIAAIMESAKAGLAPYAADAPMSLPNKVFEYMAGRLPLISSIKGELVDILEQNKCGFSYHADSVEELCSAIRKLRANEQERVQMGERARALLEAEYSTDRVFSRVNEHFKSVAKKD